MKDYGKGRCPIEGCYRPRRTAGLCNTHYERLRRTGTTEPAVRPTPEERFWAKVDAADGEACWLWKGARISSGYGTLGVAGRTTLAHRFSYQLLVGPIPAGLVIDHICRVPHCVRPSHLEPVTQQENVLRGERSALAGVNQ